MNMNNRVLHNVRFAPSVFLSFKRILIPFWVLTFVLIQTKAISQQLTINQFTGASACPTPDNTFSATANATMTPLTRSTIVCAAAANVFNSTTLNNTASRNDASYIEFSITANAASSLNLSSLSFFRQGSGTAPNSLIVSYSTDPLADNFNTTRVDMATSTTGPSPGGILTWTFPSAITTPNGGKVTFRIYPFGIIRADLGTGAAATTGTFRVDDVTLFGGFTSNQANISLSNSALSFGTLTQNSIETPRVFNVSGALLTSNVAINAPAGFTVSNSPTGTFGSSVTLTPTNGSLTNVPVYVKMSTASIGTPIGDITVTNSTLATQNVAVSGTVVAPFLVNTTIAAARALAAGTTVAIKGYVTASTQYGGIQIFIQDATGGISVFGGTENLAAVYGLKTGDFIMVSGKIGAFNQLVQLGVPLVIQKDNTPPAVQTPVTITESQMANYEGQLVKILNLTNPPGATILAANTNYNFGLTQIRVASTPNAPYSNNLVGSTINTGTSNVTGIVGRFNALYQLLPRFVEDVENVNSLPNYGLDVTYATNNTLDVGCWNMEWFGHPTLGPSDNTLQKTNVGTVLNALKLDVLNANEISDETLLSQAVTTLGSNYTYTCSQEVSNGTTVVDPNAQRVCFIYNKDIVKNATTTALMLNVKANPTAFFPNATLGYPAYPQDIPTNFFASGRLPYSMTGDVTINGVTKRIMFVGMHAKANTAPTDISYQRRQLDARVLKDNLDKDFPNMPIILMGDLNDDIDVSIYDNASPSSYKNFVDDATRYRFLTGQTSLKNRIKSTVGFNDMIDHIMMSNECFTAYENNSARVGTPDFYVPNYGSLTITDHYPVMARFNIANISSPVGLLDFKENKFKIYPNPSAQIVFIENTEGVLLDLTLFNINGQVIKKGTKTNKIDVSDLSNGMYIIEGVLENNVVVREKFFKN
jgi:Secretion system C-terminal sorting domain/Family of unknown function (DUF5689)